MPAGYLIARWYNLDIRYHGSGNIGATNVARVLGKSLFPIVFIIDAGKAFLFLYSTQNIMSEWYWHSAAIALLVGNGYSFLLQGGGGKGVATASGIIAAIAPLLLFPVFCVWLGAYAYFQLVGIASVIAAGALSLLAPWYTTTMSALITCVMSACWIVVRHKKNILDYYR